MAQGRAMLEWVGEYLEHPERYPVLSQVRPGDVRASCRRRRRSSGESLETIFSDFESKIVPGITHWNHPVVFRLFRHVVVGAGNSRRVVGGGARREGDVVADVAGGDGARAADDGLASADARAWATDGSAS